VVSGVLVVHYGAIAQIPRGDRTVAWFVRDLWQADDDSEWAEGLVNVLNELEETGHDVVAVTAQPHERGPLGRPGTRYILFSKVT
jgi:hypothetical protein